MESDSSTTATPSSALEPPSHHITTHDANGKAIFIQDSAQNLTRIEIPKMQLFEGYRSFTATINLTDAADLKALEGHHDTPDFPGFPDKGTWIRYLDWEPGAEAPLHRTETVDFGIVIRGEMEATMDSGEKRLLKAGDSIVQRGTMHAWRNPSKTETARMFFVLQGTPPPKVGETVMGEDLSQLIATFAS